MNGHRSPISGVDVHGDHIATAGYDGQVILWDGRTRLPLARGRHDHLVNQCRFSPSGRLLVTASSDQTARVWSVPELSPLAVLRGHQDDVEMAAVSPDGTRIVTASRDHRLRIFDLAGRLAMELEGHQADALSVEWVRGGRELVSSGDDGTVRRWQADSGALLDIVDAAGTETDTIAAAADGALYAGNDRGEIVLLTGPHARPHTTPAHQTGVKRLGWDPDTGQLVSASYDRTAKIWMPDGGGRLRLLRVVDLPAIVWARTFAFAPGSRIVFGSFGSAYAVCDVPHGRWDLERIEETPGLNCVRVIDRVVHTVGDAGVHRADGRVVARLGSLCTFLVEFAGRIVTGGQQGVLLDAGSGEALHQHHSPLNCGTVVRRGEEEHLIVGTYTGEGLIFRGRPGEPLEPVATLRLHDNAVKGIAANATHIFSVCATGAAAFHAIRDLDPVRTVPRAHEKIANAAVALPDGRFASVSRDRRLRLWTLDACRLIETPHSHSIKCVAASTTGRLVATGAYDGTVAVFDLGRDAWVHVTRPTTSGISSVVALDDGATFLASSYDGQIYRIDGSRGAG
jgi:WD40 repeat protein